MNRIAIILSIISFPLFLCATEPEQTPISLEQFITQTVTQSRFTEILTEELKLAYQEKIDTPAGDFVLNASSGYSFNYKYIGIHSISADIELSKMFALSGTELSAKYFLGSEVSASISQSIIKNAFGRTSRIEKQIAGYERSVASLQIIESYETYLNTVIQIYLDWYELHEKYNNAERSYEDSLSLFSNVEQKLKYNIAMPIDITKSKLQLLSKEEDRLKLKSELDSMTYHVSLLLGKDPLLFYFIPTPPLMSIDSFSADFMTINTEFKQNSRTSQINDFLLKIGSDKIKVALDDILPQASLITSYSFSGDGLAFESNRSHKVSVGMDFKIPILDPEKRNTYKVSKFDNDREAIKRGNDFEDLQIDLNELINKIKQNRSLITILEQKVELSKLIADEVLMEYNRGKSDLDNLIKDFDTLHSSRLKLDSQRIELMKNWFDMLDLVDQLVNTDKTINM